MDPVHNLGGVVFGEMYNAQRPTIAKMFDGGRNTDMGPAEEESGTTYYKGFPGQLHDMVVNNDASGLETLLSTLVLHQSREEPPFLPPQPEATMSGRVDVYMYAYATYIHTHIHVLPMNMYISVCGRQRSCLQRLIPQLAFPRVLRHDGRCIKRMVGHGTHAATPQWIGSCSGAQGRGDGSSRGILLPEVRARLPSARRRFLGTWLSQQPPWQ